MKRREISHRHLVDLRESMCSFLRDLRQQPIGGAAGGDLVMPVEVDVDRIAIVLTVVSDASRCQRAGLAEQRGDGRDVPSDQRGNPRKTRPDLTVMKPSSSGANVFTILGACSGIAVSVTSYGTKTARARRPTKVA